MKFSRDQPFLDVLSVVRLWDSRQREVYGLSVGMVAAERHGQRPTKHRKPHRSRRFEY